MKKYGKIIASIMFIVLCLSSSKESVSIHLEAYLFRTVGVNSGVIDLSYYSTPVGSFKINEVWISGHKIGVPAKEANATIGCCGIVLSAESVQYKNQKIPFDQLERELTLKTKWQGQKDEELIQKYVLPIDFEISSVSEQISNTMPLIVELKQGITLDNWDNCGLVFRNEKQGKEEIDLEYHLNDGLTSINFDPDGKSQKIVMKLDEIRKNRAGQNVETLRENFYMQLVCIKKYQSPEELVEQGFKRSISSNKFNYQISSDIYPVAIIN